MSPGGTGGTGTADAAIGSTGGSASGGAGGQAGDVSTGGADGQPAADVDLSPDLWQPHVDAPEPTVDAGSAPGTGGAPAGTGGAAGTSGSGGVLGTGGGSTAPARKFVGNFTQRGAVPGDFLLYWDQITPENEGKWGSVSTGYLKYDWSRLDGVYQFAKTNGIPFREQALIWGTGGLPASAVSGTLEERRAAVEDWIKSFCERYPGAEFIDVVNEPPPHTSPPYAEAMGGSGESGYEWIVQAFVWARTYCPRSVLTLSDYNIVEYQQDHDHFLDILAKIRAADAPVDALGVEALMAYKQPTDLVQGLLDDLAATGLPVYVTAYQIPLSDDDEQRAVMEEQFTVFWNHPGVKGITLYGYAYGATFMANGELLSSTGMLRPAMRWLMSFLGR